MVKVDIKLDHVRPMLSNVLGYGIGKWVTREYQLRFGRRIANAGEFGGLAITAVATGLQMVRDYQYEEDVRRIATGAGLTGLDDLVAVRVYGEAIAWFTDQNTLVVKNMGAFSSDKTKWKVIIDGSSVSIASVEGDTGKATINLSDTVSKGKHDVVVTLDGAKKAFSGKLFVP
jgi:glutamine cyclotransferase